MSSPPDASPAHLGDAAADPAGKVADPVRKAKPPREAQAEWLPPTSPAPQPAWVVSEGRWVVRWVAVMFVLAFGLWGAGKVACNHHPLTSLNFKPVTLEALTDRPKNAALEFHHALTVGDAETARQLAMSSELDWLEAQLEACDAACAQRQKEWRGVANTRAELHVVRGNRAEATAETHHEGTVIGGRYLVIRDGKQWKVARRLDDNAAGAVAPAEPFEGGNAVSSPRAP